MNKKNEKYFEHKIGWYRQLFTLFFAVEIGCIAWLIANYNKTIEEIIILDLITILIISSILGIMISKVKKYIKLLKEE